MNTTVEIHPALQEILDGVGVTGWHVCRWSALRSSVYPNASDGWAQLKAWCAENELACEICYSQSSKKSEVQFHGKRLRPAPTPEVQGAVMPEAAAIQNHPR